MKEPTQDGLVIGRYEIAEIFHVSRQGTQSIIDHPEFPAPICLQGKHEVPLFWRRDVEVFRAERERKQRELAAKAAA